jgi:hypothetical protein
MLEDSINTHFSALLKNKGFRIIAEDHSDERFGNAFMDVESPEFRLRFVSDRGQVFVEIGSNTPDNKWLELRVVRSLVLDRDLLQIEEYNELALFLEQHYSTLAAMFNSENISETTLRYYELKEKRQRKLHPKWFEL